MRTLRRILSNSVVLAFAAISLAAESVERSGPLEPERTDGSPSLVELLDALQEGDDERAHRVLDRASLLPPVYWIDLEANASKKNLLDGRPWNEERADPFTAGDRRLIEHRTRIVLNAASPDRDAWLLVRLTDQIQRYVEADTDSYFDALTRHPDPAVRFLGYAYRESDRDANHDRLLRAWAFETEPWVRAEILEQLRPDGEAVPRDVLAAAGAVDDGLAIAVARLLVPDAPDSLRAWRGQLRDARSAVRLEALASALRYIRFEGDGDSDDYGGDDDPRRAILVEDAFRVLLEDPSSAVRSAAGEAWFALDFKGARAFARTTARSPDVELRRFASRVLSISPEERDRKRLFALAADLDPQVRSTAVEGLTRLPAEGVDAFMWDVVRDEGDGSFWRAAHYLKRRILERSPEEIAEGAVRFRDMASRVETEHVRQRLLRMANEFEGRLETLAFECGSHWIPEPWMLVASEGARTVRCDPDPFRDDDGHETIRLPAGEKIRTDLRMDDPSGARWVRVQLHGRRCWVPEAHVRLAPADPPGPRDGGVDVDRLGAVEFDLPAGLADDPSLIALLRIPGVDRFEAATERFGVRIAAALADRWRDDAAGEWRPPFDGFFEAPWFDRLRHAFDARPD